MKYRYERIDVKAGRVVDRLTADSAEELIKCIRMLENCSKHTAKSDKSNKGSRNKK